MATSARELVGWSDQRWQTVQEAVEKALAGTAKCRQVVPNGPEKIGEKAIIVPTINLAPPISYGPDQIATPIHVFVDAVLDDQHSQNEGEIIRIMEVAAAQLGVLEDEEIVQGGFAVPAAGGGAAAPLPAPPPAVPRFGRCSRNPALARMAARAPAGGVVPTLIGAGGANPNGDQLYAAIASGVANLETAGRPGRFALLVHNNLMATLRQPRTRGGVPLIQEVEGLIGSSEIIGTSALDGTFNVGSVGGILFRLEPPAMDLIHTMLPTVTVLGRAAGSTDLRVEEEIVLRILDPAAIQTIAY